MLVSTMVYQEMLRKLCIYLWWVKRMCDKIRTKR